MEQGKLVEFGTPSDLKNREGGIFADMMKKHSKDMLK